jgi:putative protein-disulfide isomerase
MALSFIYCYDAYCGWCYGFSPVIKQLSYAYQPQIHTEVLSGGMLLPEQPTHVRSIAGFVSKAYQRVEELTGITFGQDFLWHMFNPEDSDWFPNSEKPAIALCIFKEYHPEKQVDFAADLQYALNYEGRDLTDNEAYRHLLSKYEINADDFYAKLAQETYKDKAHYEFSLCKHLQVTGFPCVFLQVNDSKLYLLAKGFTPYEAIKERVDRILAELENEQQHDTE